MAASQFSDGLVTKILALISVLVFVITLLTGLDGVAAYAGGFIPARVADPGLLDGAGLGLPVVPLLLTPITSTFLHGGWLHLIFNMMMLFFCGRQVEMVLGGRLLIVLYAVGAYAAAAGQWMLEPDVMVPMIGASGAISAIIGAYALLFSNNDVRPLGPVPAYVVRMIWLGAGWITLQFLIGYASGLDSQSLTGGSDGIAIGAHMGGFIAGMLLVRPLLKVRFRRNPL
ncbi:MAG: rhomboid family intramembrane serine protease [Sphingobium sp.]|nr:rhomboid family intramembrane serine protease [Sphingobium sp.]